MLDLKQCKTGRWRARATVLCFVILLAAPARSQTPTPPSPSLLPPAQQLPLPGGSSAPASPGRSLTNPNGQGPTGTITVPAAPSATQAVSPAALGGGGQVALAVSARYSSETAAINGGLYWRVYSDKPEQSGQFKLIKEERVAAPTFMLAPGGYIVHVSFGLAEAVKRIQLNAESAREVFEIAAGGARFEGRVGDNRIPTAQISFDLYKGSQFEGGEKRPIVQQVASGDVVLVPEGIYHVVSNYGDGNSVMRSDLRVLRAKLTDTVIVHRAAKITLKLVGERGGEALASTAWSVLTPGGDVIKESIGAFPVVILAEGDYVAIARNEGRVFNREFKVEAGVDREIEVLAR